VLGPGDDATAVRVPAGEVLVSSIDALVAGVHFPAAADPELVGFRSLMVSLSDLAAMGAGGCYALVSVSLESGDDLWVLGLARGMRDAAREAGALILGGNLSRGPRAVHVSVHGFAPERVLLRRDAARPGDRLYVTGALGGAAAALERGVEDTDLGHLDSLTERYFRPRARLEAGRKLRGHAACAIDVSDGLLQDLGHVCRASNVQAFVNSDRVPVFPGASLDQALNGGDDYELLFAASAPPPDLGVAVTEIGGFRDGEGVLVDGEPASARGYQHF
jgi:thiamine-monophosphate kinase